MKPTSFRLTMGLAAAAAFAVCSTSPAPAQYIDETPDGHQTVGPAQMYQQPSEAQEFYQHGAGRTMPPSVGLDQPGIPGVQMQTAGNGVQSNVQPPTNGTKNGMQVPGTNSGGAPGALILPQGESSTVRVVPMWNVSAATRVALGAWLLLQLVVAIIVAFALQFKHKHDEDVYQGGHIINEDYREPNVT